MVAYYRVSTKAQGASGLGLDAQRAIVAQHVAAYGCDLIGEYTEVESAAKDDLDNRPALQKALAHAKRAKATVVIGKLDRLARSVYVTALLHKANVDFVACDMPTANRMTVQFMAVVAENEARLISERTRVALRAYVARGGVLGAARPECRWNLTDEARAKGVEAAAKANRTKKAEAYEDLIPMIRDLQADGKSLRQIADALNADGHTTRRGRPWNPMQVRRVLALD
jgi:DNA invertase Pin-like site-specific DNA recombinase